MSIEAEQAGRQPKEKKYVQIAGSLREQIVGGRYDQKLPSLEHLAQQYKTSPITLRAAIQILVEDRTLVVRHGIGIFSVKDYKSSRVLPIIPSELRTIANLNSTQFGHILKVNRAKGHFREADFTTDSGGVIRTQKNVGDREIAQDLTFDKMGNFISVGITKESGGLSQETIYKKQENGKFGVYKVLLRDKVAPIS